MAGLSYKPLSYTELSTYQLLCIRGVYQLIDTICADKYADWNIIDFEKAVVSNKYPNSYDEQSVRTAIESNSGSGTLQFSNSLICACIQTEPYM